MDALRKEDGPNERNEKKGQEKRLMGRNTEDCLCFTVAPGEKWMAPVKDLEVCRAAVDTLRGNKTLTD
jgi:hypothetical protein